jgi:hypothetical protein
MSNLKILRLNNTASNPKLTLTNNNSGFNFILNEDLRVHGRCLIEVISGWSQITRQTLNNGVVNNTDRILPNNIPQLVIRSNIQQEGEDTLTGGSGVILGTMSLVNTNNHNGGGSETTNSGFFNQNDSLKFMCNELPSQIQIERMYYDDNNNLVHADNLAGNELVPMEVVLQLTFLDMKD